jgi:hypothetical protein
VEVLDIVLVNEQIRLAVARQPDEVLVVELEQALRAPGYPSASPDPRALFRQLTQILRFCERLRGALVLEEAICWR